jgi:hypothetical protein
MFKQVVHIVTTGLDTVKTVHSIPLSEVTGVFYTSYNIGILREDEIRNW